MSKTIGVIGLGSIGMRHAKNLKALGHHVWGYDPNISKRLEHGFDLCGSKIEDIMGADALVIASPTSMHSQHIKMALDAKKPIFCEKPISDHDVTDTVHRIAMVGYNLRFHSCVIKAKEWIEAGLLGQPIWANFVCAQYNNKEDYRRDGVILNWSHEIDLALHLLGAGFVKAASANKSESLADIVLLHSNECRSTVHLDYLTLPEVRQTIIVGDHATIILDLVRRNAWLRDTRGTIIDSFTGYDSYDDNYKDEMETFIARIEGQETVGCTGKEGRDVLNVCLSAKEFANLFRQ